MTGQAPFTGKNETDTYSNITNLDLQKTDNTVRPFNSLSYEAQHFCQQILMTDPAQRMSLQQMRNHSWLRQAYESSVATSAPSACSVAQEHRQTGQGSSCSFVPSNVLAASDANNRQAQPEEVNTSTETVKNLSTNTGYKHL